MKKLRDACAKKGRYPGARWKRHKFCRTISAGPAYKPSPRPLPSARLRLAAEVRKKARERFADARDGLKVPKTRPDFIHDSTGSKLRATIIFAPHKLSLATNWAEFLGFIYEYQFRTYIEAPEARGRYRPLSIDLSGVKSMSLDAALVLTAEYHRLCLRLKIKPVIDDASWPGDVRALFDMLGFYRLVNASDRTGVVGDYTSPQRFVPFISDETVDGAMAQSLIDSLRDVAGRAPANEPTYAALVEAIMNVINHAYGAVEEPSIIPSVSRWWAAGAYDPRNEMLSFAVYDQGIGIPATLPRKTFFEAILTFCPPERNDADLIAGGIEYGRTGTDFPERGNGLWTICQLVEQLPGSHVRIWSGRGQIDYQPGGRIKKKLHRNPFCGTLVQWNLKLPSVPKPAAQPMNEAAPSEIAGDPR